MTFAPSSLARRAFYLVTLILSVLGVARPAAAADDPILPFLDDGTFIVARLDVDRVDPAEVERFINDAADVVVKRGGLPADRQVKIKQESTEAIAKAKAWLTDMQAAGGKRVYGMFLNSEDLLRNSDDPYFIVPMADGGDAARIGELMKQGLGGRWEAETVGKSLVLGKQVHIDRVRTQSQSGGPGKSIEPADFAAAFAGKGGAVEPTELSAEFAITPMISQTLSDPREAAKRVSPPVARSAPEACKSCTWMPTKAGSHLPRPTARACTGMDPVPNTALKYRG
jgi:hypothetical protein